MLELDIGASAAGGSCVARAEDGRVVFVRHALPGERVRAVVTEGTADSRYLRADAVEVLDASADRVRPPCPYAGPGKCGGCDWQHASRSAQLGIKAELVRAQLRRLAGLDPAVQVEELPGAPDGLGWRTRVSFAVRPDGVVGLRRSRSHEVEPVDRCRIAHESVTAVGAERRRWPGATAVEVIAAAGTGDRAVVVTPADPTAELTAPPLDAPSALLRDDGRGGATSVRGRPGVREVAAGRSWRVSGSGFWQVHPAAADALVAAVLAGLGPRPGETALDLYAGVGLFAGALAPHLDPGGSVIAVEADRVAAADAAYNLRDLPTVQVQPATVRSALRRLGGTSVDLIVLDPPRAGAGPALCRQLARLGPRAVAYVSCDPATLARDLGAFAAAGYHLAQLRAFDLFPMTAHVECVAVLNPGAPS